MVAIQISVATVHAMTLKLILVIIASLCFATSAALAIRQMMTPSAQSSAQQKTMAYIVASVGCAAHLLFLHNAIIIPEGQDMSITNVLSLVAWLICVAMMISARLLPNTVLLPGVYLFAMLSVVASGVVPDHYVMHIEVRPSLVIHISLSLLAYGCFAIAFLYALQMSFISHKLKHKQASLLHSPLPPLMLVESVLFKLTIIGTGLLSVSLISGFAFVNGMFSSQYAHKTVLSILALAVYALLLFGQQRWGWRNRQVIMLTSIGIGLLTLSYFGSRFVREVLL